MSYVVRGLGGLGCISSSSLAAACGDSGSGGCDPRDPGCVAAAQYITDWSQEVLAQYFPCIPDDLQIQCPSMPNADALLLALQNNTPIDPLPNNSYTAPAGNGGSSMGSPVVSFAPSRSGGNLYPGDTWTVNIQGGAPYAQVLANMGGSITPMGTTDASGNFSLSGTITANQTGKWNESWSVGGVNAGSFSFGVSPTPAVPPPAGGGSTVINSNGVNNAPGGSTGGGSTSTPATQWISGFSNTTVLAVGAGALLLYFMSGKR